MLKTPSCCSQPKQTPATHLPPKGMRMTKVQKLKYIWPIFHQEHLKEKHKNKTPSTSSKI